MCWSSFCYLVFFEFNMHWHKQVPIGWSDWTNLTVDRTSSSCGVIREMDLFAEITKQMNEKTFENHGELSRIEKNKWIFIGQTRAWCTGLIRLLKSYRDKDSRSNIWFKWHTNLQFILGIYKDSDIFVFFLNFLVFSIPG